MRDYRRGAERYRLVWLCVLCAFAVKNVLSKRGTSRGLDATYEEMSLACVGFHLKYGTVHQPRLTA